MSAQPPGNLNCILLNASGAAYNIAPGTSTYIPDNVYSPNVPYVQGPETACGGEGLINAATVGQCPFGIVVAFRGTLLPSPDDISGWLDSMQSFFAVPASSPSGPNKIPGQVHSGFFNATTSIIHKVQSLVSSYNPGTGNPVFLTGHSKGGAMASIAAYILSQNLGIPNVQPLVTFASPKPGDVDFQAGFQSVLSQTRYEDFQDIIPLLPPTIDFIEPMLRCPGLSLTEAGRTFAHLLESAREWTYVPVGKMLFITRSFTVIENEDVKQQTLDVVVEFAEDILQLNFCSVLRAHTLLPGNGFQNGVCGSTS